MSETIQLRIRHPEGQNTLDTLKTDSTIRDLKQEIAKLIKAKVGDIVLRGGYPPAPLDHSDQTRLSDAEISSGETIIVEVQPQEEVKIQEEPKVSQKPQTNSSYITKESKTVQESSVRKPVEEKISNQQSSKYPSRPRESEPSHTSYNNVASYNYSGAGRGNTSTNSGSTNLPGASSILDRKSKLDELAKNTSKDPKVQKLPSKEYEPKKYDTRNTDKINVAPVKDPLYDVKNDKDFKRLRKKEEQPPTSESTRGKIVPELGMTQDEYDSMLAKIMQESMDVENLGESPVASEQRPNLEPQRTTNRLPATRSTTASQGVTKPTTRTVTTRQQSGKAKNKNTGGDLDEEYARSFQK